MMLEDMTSVLATTAREPWSIVPRSRDLLAATNRVIVVTNSHKVPNDYFTTARPEPGDSFVVFNRHRFEIPSPLTARTIWVHRLDDSTGRYFGESADDQSPSDSFHHLGVAGCDPCLAAVPAGWSYLSYRAPLPELRAYPVGRRLLIPQRGIRCIVSPSTGFLIFAWLAELRSRGIGFDVRAVGVGREFHGWPGHDWSFERRRLLASDIDFRTPDGRADHWRSVLDGIPFELVRVARKLTAWRLRPRVRRPARVAA